MRHLGNIEKINGAEITPVDCITFGSPCQDLSIAGRRAGLDGERSGLFMQAVRVIKEMRCATNGVYPTFAVWENVPGAFSSNGGEDFRTVLEELARIAEPGIAIPRPDGRWSKAGYIRGRDWSIAWRQLDAQYWGVPQRRKRIALVVDFRGQRAAEILFEREGVRGNPAQSCAARQGIARNPAAGAGANRDGGQCYDARGNGRGNTAPTVTGDHNGHISDYTAVVCEPCYCLQGNGINRADTAGCSGAGWRTGESYTLNTVDRPAVVYAPTVSQSWIVRRLTPTECERLQGYPEVIEVNMSKMTKDEYIAWNLQQKNIIVDADKGKVFATRGPGGVRLAEPKELLGSTVNGYKVVSIRNGATKLQCRVHRIIWISQNGIVPEGYCIDHINSDKTDNRISNLQLLTPSENSHKAHEDGLFRTGKDNPATKVAPELHDEIACLYYNTELTLRELAEIYGISKSRIQQIVKRDGWTDLGEWTDSKGKKHKPADTPRYKALGNSIALPQWWWLVCKMAAYLPEKPTLGSLFDGIGGFPLVWETRHGKGTAVWASEIEEFCIAVTKKRFAEN